MIHCELFSELIVNKVNAAFCNVSCQFFNDAANRT